MNWNRSPRANVTRTELRAYLHEVLLAATVLGVIIVCGAALSIAWDIRAMRINQMIAQAEWRAGLFARIDAFLWRSDSFLKIEEAIQKSMAAGFVQVRVQQAQSSAEQEKAIKAVAANTKEAVKQTLEGASEAMQQPAPVVNVQSAKPAAVAPPSVIVNPMLNAPRAPAKPPTAAEPEPEEKHRWRWLRYLWPGNWKSHGRTTGS